MKPGRPEVAGRDQLPINRQPLFWLEDIGIDGLRRWLIDYHGFGRPVWVLAASLYQQHQIIEPRLLHVGAALEALGYHLASKHNQLPGGRQQFHFTDAVNTICNQTDCDLKAVTGADPDAQAWCSDVNRVYKGVKHADNPLPDSAEAVDLTERGVRLARLWLARYLGVDRGELESRVEHMA